MRRQWKDSTVSAWESVGWPDPQLPPEIYTEIAKHAAKGLENSCVLVHIRFKIRLCEDFDFREWQERRKIGYGTYYLFRDEDDIEHLAVEYYYLVSPGCNLQTVVADAMCRSNLPDNVVRGERGWFFGSEVNHTSVGFVLLSQCLLPVVGNDKISLLTWFAKTQ
jgi:hypothetical protein